MIEGWVFKVHKISLFVILYDYLLLHHHYLLVLECFTDHGKVKYCFLSVSLLFVIIFIISTHLMSLSLKWHVFYFHEYVYRYVLLITLCFIRSLLIFFIGFVLLMKR